MQNQSHWLLLLLLCNSKCPCCWWPKRVIEIYNLFQLLLLIHIWAFRVLGWIILLLFPFDQVYRFFHALAIKINCLNIQEPSHHYLQLMATHSLSVLGSIVLRLLIYCHVSEFVWKWQLTDCYNLIRRNRWRMLIQRVTLLNGCCQLCGGGGATIKSTRKDIKWRKEWNGNDLINNIVLLRDVCAIW